MAFPEPLSVSVVSEGIRYIRLERLLELKLASGMTGSGRQKDIGDVVALIQTLNLPRDLADRLSEYVRPTYRELWKQARQRYVRLGRKTPTTAADLERMQADGITVEPAITSAEDHVLLVTYDPAVAEKYALHKKDELWNKES